MKKAFILLTLCIAAMTLRAQKFPTVFENSNGNKTATYFETIEYYKKLKAVFPTLSIKAFDTTDAGYPLHLVLFSKDKKFDPKQWHNQNKVVVLVNNGIHPGEPDGIDASMMLIRDLATNKIVAADNVVFAIIPVYNIGGCLNRGTSSRVNQNGPEEYGFRGNSENLDLNRDFIKNDSRDAISFTRIFQWLQPDIFIDNHVSDGADYQHTMTLLTTQHNKLGGETGAFVHNTFEPALYKSMSAKKWDMIPYVNFEDGNPNKGWDAYYDPPRYSSGYAALFQTIAFVPETHMLKPYADRVKSTYAFMQSIMEQSSLFASDIIEKRKTDIENNKKKKDFAVSWTVDTTKFDQVLFKGYQTNTKTSDITGMPRMFYDHSKPFEKQVKFYNTFNPVTIIQKPSAYIVPQGWHEVIDRLKNNGVELRRLTKDTALTVEFYHVDDYKSMPRAYEKHHRNFDLAVSKRTEQIHFVKGDYIIFTGQRSDRYIVETLEPQGDDSFFSWNFFDAILQQKEWYSDYRLEDVAGKLLQQHPEIKQALEEKKKSDPQFAANAKAQLQFVYIHSNYYEPAHLRIPVFRVN